MKKRKEKQLDQQESVEFGNEFGDINAAKFYELQFAGKKDKCDSKKQK